MTKPAASVGIDSSPGSGSRKVAPVNAATSRAIPTILRASARFAVAVKSKITSSKPKSDRTSAPSLRFGKSSSPLASAKI